MSLATLRLTVVASTLGLLATGVPAVAAGPSARQPSPAATQAVHDCGVLFRRGQTAAAGASQASEAGSAAPRQLSEASTPARRSKGKPPCLSWVNADIEPKAAVLCVHGLGLHNASYEDFGKRMSAAGIATYAVDVRGFGSWMNNQGHENVDFDGCLEDIHDTLKVIHRVHPGLPVFILGESMGGAIAMRAAALYPDLVSGLISCVPAGDRFKQTRTALRVAMHALGGINRQFDVGTVVAEQASESKSKDGSVNETLKADWIGDPLNRLKLSPKELWQFQRFMNENHDFAKKIQKTPVLMLQGADDNLVKAAGTLELLQNIPVDNRDVNLIVIRDAKHLIFEEAKYNDPAFNDKVFRLVNGWIDDHSQSQVATRAVSQVSRSAKPSNKVNPKED
jgi:alpha-beta hydrolase superfamily lysophospholipase